MAWRNDRSKNHGENIIDFIDSVKNLPLKDMRQITDEKLESLKEPLKNLQSTPGKSNEFQDLFKFYKNLKQFRSFIEDFSRPEGIHPKLFKHFYWITQKLIQKGEVSDEVAKLFEG